MTAFGLVRSALLTAVFLCCVDCCFGSWVLLGLFRHLRVTHSQNSRSNTPASATHGHTSTHQSCGTNAVDTVPVSTPGCIWYLSLPTKLLCDINTGTATPATPALLLRDDQSAGKGRRHVATASPELCTVIGNRCIARRTNPRFEVCGQSQQRCALGSHM